MLQFIIKRIFQLIPVLIGISLITFTLLFVVVPGDPARAIAGQKAEEETLERIREKWHLNDAKFFAVKMDSETGKPYVESQYLRFLGRMLPRLILLHPEPLTDGGTKWVDGAGDVLWLEVTGDNGEEAKPPPIKLGGNHYIFSIFDFGKSTQRQEPARKLIWEHWKVTFTLALSAMILSVLIGVPAGIISALKPYSFVDYAVMVLALIGVSMPVFWLGLMLQMAIPEYSIGLEGTSWFPATEEGEMFNLWTWFAGGLWKLSLPGFCLATIPMAIIARMTRSNMLEVLNLDYIRTAWAKGLSGRAVVVKHALRNSLMPVITVIGLNFAYLLAGAILTEQVFSVPGLGSLMIGGIMVRDFPVVMGGTVFIALAFVTINLVVDIIYALVNPRIKLG